MWRFVSSAVTSRRAVGPVAAPGPTASSRAGRRGRRAARRDATGVGEGGGRGRPGPGRRCSGRPGVCVPGRPSGRCPRAEWCPGLTVDDCRGHRGAAPLDPTALSGNRPSACGRCSVVASRCSEQPCCGRPGGLGIREALVGDVGRAPRRRARPRVSCSSMQFEEALDHCWAGRRSRRVGTSIGVPEVDATGSFVCWSSTR